MAKVIAQTWVSIFLHFNNFLTFFFSFSFFPYVFVRLCFRFCLNWTFVIQGLSSVLKQRDFYDPRFITWIESRFDTYVNFGKKIVYLILVSAFLGKLLGFGLILDFCWFWISFFSFNFFEFQNLFIYSQISKSVFGDNFAFKIEDNLTIVVKLQIDL